MSRSVPGGSRVPRGLVWVVYAVFLLIPIYLATVGLLGDALAEGQTGGGLAPMVAAHYFEHSLDYLFVVLLLIGVLSIRRPRPPHRP